MDKVVALAKRRGFIFPSSEIYGGLSGFYDYGPYGVARAEPCDQAAVGRRLPHRPTPGVVYL